MVNWLREIGHDVWFAAEVLSSEPDTSILEVASRSLRVLLTRDRDFGELVFRERRVAHGVILARIRAKNQWERLLVFQHWWPQIENRVAGHFVVVSNTRFRVRSLPPLG